MEYPKINTLFKRDSNNIIVPSEYTEPEFEYLKDLEWEATEKIDGTNIRIIVNPSSDSNISVEYRGRTDNANIPTHLLEKLKQMFTVENIAQVFNKPDKPLDTQVILYGEGYGVKIQKGGNYIPDDVSFILFDVKVGDWWLSRESCEDIAAELNIDIVPLIGYMTIPQAIEYVKNGFKSTIAHNKDYDAEGLVLKTQLGLRNRAGNRLITKIKTVDFRKLKASQKNSK